QSDFRSGRNLAPPFVELAMAIRAAVAAPKRLPEGGRLAEEGLRGVATGAYDPPSVDAPSVPDDRPIDQRRQHETAGQRNDQKDHQEFCAGHGLPPLFWLR